MSSLSPPHPCAFSAVAVSVGHKVGVGDLLFTIKAMKMEMGLRVERGAMVKAIHVQPDSQIEANDQLLEFAEERYQAVLLTRISLVRSTGI
jgi:pyruvate carboxylase